MILDIENCPEFLKPRLRIFLSADIVGSTSLKQSRLGASPEQIRKQHSTWFSAIQGFYIEARQSVIREWEEAKNAWPNQDEHFGAPPEIWKTIGDEVIFVKVVTDYRQVAVILKCWIKALNSMRDFLQEENSKLDVKSTAWLAGFPVENKEVVLSLEPRADGKEIEDYFKESGEILNRYYSEKSKDGISLDFIGPAIDIGFRLGGQSSNRRFILSVGITYILSLTNPTRNKLLEDFDVFYSGSVPLKGVLGGLTYPVFWIDLAKDDSLAIHEDRLTRFEPPGRDAIRRYCEAFYIEHSAYIFPPFIASSSEQQLTSVPHWYGEVHSNLAKNFTVKSADEPTTDTETDSGTEHVDTSKVDEVASDLGITARAFSERRGSASALSEEKTKGEQDSKLQSQ